MWAVIGALDKVFWCEGDENVKVRRCLFILFPKRLDSVGPLFLNGPLGR